MSAEQGTLSGRAVTVTAIFAALASGALSLLLGQDRNWDLRNYHLYNAYAWLEGRLGFDLAPAQFQSYFTPLIDVPYFLIVRHASAEWAGFALGAWHGLSFALVAVVAVRLLGHEDGGRRTALWLAAAGCTSAAFLSELGTTMGDNTTAVFVLGALILAWPANGLPLSVLRFILAGACLGLAVALKLTNAIYAVGLGAAVALQPGLHRPVRAFAWLATSAVLTFAVVAGPWHWALWSTFGNPLFPQFNAWFGGALAESIGVADAQWGPRHLGEVLVWPMVFTLDPLRVGTSPLPQAIWGVLYVTAVGTGVHAIRRGARPWSEWRSAGVGGRFVFVFFVASFVAWMAVFNIHRYLTVLELIAPVVLWYALRPVWPRLAKWAVASSAAVSLLGWNTWGHAPWGEQDFRVEQPVSPLASVPATVLLVGNEPVAWMVPFLPQRWRYVAVASNFPESPAYRARVRGHVQTPGYAFAIVPAHADRRAARAARIETMAHRIGLDDCVELEIVTRYVKYVTIEHDATGRCRLKAESSGANNTAEVDRALVVQAAEALRPYGLTLSAGRCRVLKASIGAEARPYQWCPVRPIAH